MLDPDDAALIAGFLVNKFRGDPALFADGMRRIARAHRLAGSGPDAVLSPTPRALPAEDALGARPDVAAASRGAERHDRGAAAAAYREFRRSGSAEAGTWLRVVMVAAGEPLPGTPSGDPAGLESDDRGPRGFPAQRLGHRYARARAARRAGVGICGGYQMLGRAVADPDGIEGPAGDAPGLGLLDVETVLAGEKTLRAVAGVSLADGAPFPATRCISGAPRAGSRAPAAAVRRRAAGRGDLRRWPRARHLCARPVRGRPPARAHG